MTTKTGLPNKEKGDLIKVELGKNEQRSKFFVNAIKLLHGDILLLVNLEMWQNAV